jgi:hypothetical protein
VQYQYFEKDVSNSSKNGACIGMGMFGESIGIRSSHTAVVLSFSVLYYSV